MPEYSAPTANSMRRRVKLRKNKDSRTGSKCSVSVRSDETMPDAHASPGSDDSQSDSETGDGDSSLTNPANAIIEHCGLLTINQRTYSVECEVARPRPKSKTTIKVPTVPPPVRSTKSTANVTDTITISTSSTRYRVVGLVARQMGWKCARGNENCNILWTDSLMGADTCRLVRRYQKINHFPGMFEICRKDMLARNLNRMLKMFPSDYDFFPKTWHLPADHGEAIQYARYNRNKTYILKPDQGAQGRGIWLTRSLKTINPTEHMICQLYINRPLLIDGFKFDLRVYALITSIDPLRVYVFNEGLVRFATSPYQPPKGHNTTNMYMHLTNYSVNKHSRTYSKDDEVGSKRKFSTFNRILSAEGYDVVTLWNAIDDVVIKTVLSAWPVLRHNYNTSFPVHDFMPACFEILGVDIMIDQNMKPWLLEVNHSPSFNTDGPVDTEVKSALIRDTFTMLNIRPSDKKRIMEEDRKRITARLLKRIYENGDNLTSNKPSGGSEAISKENMQKQVEWEETHMGGYRRVFPMPGDPHKYQIYMETQGQTSVCSDTVASKRREEAARVQRIMLAERERFPVPIKSFNKIQTEDAPPEKKKKRRKPIAISDGFCMEHVSDTEERGRVALMNQRHFLVESCGVIQYILVGFHRNRLLTEQDVKKYEGLYEALGDTSFSMMPQERPLQLKSLSDTVTNGIIM